MVSKLVLVSEYCAKKLKTLNLVISFGYLLITIFLPLKIMAAESSITITSPQDSSSVININTQIKGKAPPSTIITVVIKDTDTNRFQIAHQSSGQVIGSATSSGIGDWTYVPGVTLVPGQFSVQASYTNSDNQAINSNTVQFVVVNSQGASEQISGLLIRFLITFISIIFIILCVTIFFLIRRRLRSTRSIKAKETAIAQIKEYRERKNAAQTPVIQYQNNPPSNKGQTSAPEPAVPNPIVRPTIPPVPTTQNPISTSYNAPAPIILQPLNTATQQVPATMAQSSDISNLKAKNKLRFLSRLINTIRNKFKRK